jgi:hypothetical protein
VLPPDLPGVVLAGTPERFRRADLPAGQGGYWEWLRVVLPGVGEIAVFDPDHLCPPGFFGRPCRLGIEFFHPAVGSNPARLQGITPATERGDPEQPPVVAGRVAAHHRHEWHYTGPVTNWEERDGARAPVVTHVIAAPQTTLRLVLDLGIGTALAQLRDPADAPEVGAWVTLRDGRAELVAIEKAEAPSILR